MRTCRRTARCWSSFERMRNRSASIRRRWRAEKRGCSRHRPPACPAIHRRRSHRVCGQSRLSRWNLRHQPRRHERAAVDERRQLAGLVAGWSADCVSHGRSRRRSGDPRHHARRDDPDARQGETPRDQSALRRAARRPPHRGDERGPRLGRNLAALTGAVIQDRSLLHRLDGRGLDNGISDGVRAGKHDGPRVDCEVPHAGRAGRDGFSDREVRAGRSRG